MQMTALLSDSQLFAPLLRTFSHGGLATYNSVIPDGPSDGRKAKAATQITVALSKAPAIPRRPNCSVERTAQHLTKTPRTGAFGAK